MVGRSRLLALAAGLLLAACSQGNRHEPRVPETAGTGETATAGRAGAAPADRRAWFGALHVHTSISFDAFTNRTRTMPEDAFRWARGEAIEPGVNGVKNRN
jgi:hypothetical protein